MKRMLLALMLPALLLTACGSSPEEKAVETMEELATTIDGIKSADDVSGAIKKIEELGPVMKELEAELEKKYETKSFEEKIDKDLKERVEKAQKKIMDAMGRIAKDPKLLPEMMKLGKAMEAIK